jgi:CO dehydrogenase maturation factor
VKIAFAGKGGSGKTTLSSLYVRHLAAQGLPVVAADADINQDLAEALGARKLQVRDCNTPDRTSAGALRIRH